MAKEWRNEVAYRSMIVLRTAVEVTNYNTNKIPAWDIAELSGSELQFAIDGATATIFDNNNDKTNNTNNNNHPPTVPSPSATRNRQTSLRNNFVAAKQDNEEDGIFLDSLRVPTRMAYLLRESICSQEERLTHPMHIQLENKLLGSVDSILQGYYG